LIGGKKWENGNCSFFVPLIHCKLLKNKGFFIDLLLALLPKTVPFDPPKGHYLQDLAQNLIKRTKIIEIFKNNTCNTFCLLYNAHIKTGER